MAKIVAVIDIGSNSARMAIFARTSRYGFYLLEEKKSRVRISEGSYENGALLQEIPKRRTIEALKDFVSIAKSRGARKFFCVATSAVRDAPNASEFIIQVKKECGLDIKVIDGKKEAYFGALACSKLLHQNHGISIDVGGGSSECAVLDRGKIGELVSLNIGAIRIKELFFDGKNDLDGAKAFIKKELNKLPVEFKSKCALGIGGSIRALSKLIAKEEGINFLHGLELDAKSYIEFSEKICMCDFEELKALGFSEDRVDSIKSGALIFAMFLEHFGSKKVITSGVGVREGVFLDDLSRHKDLIHSFNPSYRSLLDRFELKSSRGKNIKKEALRLFDCLISIHKCTQEHKRLLGVASRLCVLGESLGVHSQSSHSAYLAYTGLEYCFSQYERKVIATLIEFSGKKTVKESKLDGISFDELKILSDILSLAKTLSVGSKNLKYEWNGKLRIEGESYLAREYIRKTQKTLSFEVVFGSNNVANPRDFLKVCF